MGNDSRMAELEQAARRFGEAWAAGDVAALDAMLSPSYTHTDLFGEFLERGPWLDYARGRTGRSSSIEFRDVKTRILGDVAIMTGTNIVRGGGGRNAADREDLVLRFTQVWIWHGGRWLREAFQATPRDATQRAS